MIGKWIYYDPDFRREARATFTGKPYCECCFREVDIEKAVRVQTSYDFRPGSPEWVAAGIPFEMTAREHALGTHFIGAACWKRLVREHGFESANAPPHTKDSLGGEGE